MPDRVSRCVVCPHLFIMFLLCIPMMMVNWPMRPVTSGSWMNNSAYGAEYPEVPDGLAPSFSHDLVHDIMREHVCWPGRGCLLSRLYKAYLFLSLPTLYSRRHKYPGRFKGRSPRFKRDLVNVSSE